jgi:hypothetical protein
MPSSAREGYLNPSLILRSSSEDGKQKDFGRAARGRMPACQHDSISTATHQISVDNEDIS